MNRYRPTTSGSIALKVVEINSIPCAQTSLHVLTEEEWAPLRREDPLSHPVTVPEWKEFQVLIHRLHWSVTKLYLHADGASNADHDALMVVVDGDKKRRLRDVDMEGSENDFVINTTNRLF